MLSYMFSPEHDGMRWYAHAGGLADISFLLEPLLEMGYQCEGAFSGSSVIMLKVTKGKHSWMHIDSFWTIRKKLADVGKIIGILKPEVDTDKCSMAELLDRNEQDCVILYRALQRLEDQLLQLGGELRITLASCALDIFRRGHLKSYIPRNEDANTWARAGYTASRVEVFRYQCTHADYYDINSSFPASMAAGPLPGRYLFNTPRLMPGRQQIIHAIIEVPECEYPPLPHRSRGRVYHPYGRLEGYYTHDDMMALELAGGRILTVHDTMVFEDLWDLKAFAEELYAARCKFDPESYEYLIYKLLLNSLYGKFGEKRSKSQLYLDPERTKGLTMLTPGVWVDAKCVDLQHEHPAISMAITARSRLSLYKLILSSAPSYYCDTDAVIGSVRHPTSEELGGVKHEGWIRDGEMMRPKLYTYDGWVENQELHDPFRRELTQKRVVRAKGFSKLTYEEFCRLRSGHAISRHRMLRVREQVQRGALGPSEREMAKKLRQDYVPNRCRLENGLTRPWHVSEIMMG